MKIVEQLAMLSYDKKHQVCAMAVKKDFSDIHKYGYNGNYKGGLNERDSMEHGKSGFLHAEDNWINFKTLEKEQIKKYILFLTMTPCEICMKKLVNTGIKEICILNEYINCGNTYNIANNTNIKIYFLKDKIKKILTKNGICDNFYQKIKPINNNLNKNYFETLNYYLEDFFDINQKPLSKIENLKNEITFNTIHKNYKKEEYIKECFSNDFFNILYKIL